MHEGLQKLYDTHWSENWTDLPPEAEKHTERAFEHIVAAREIVEREEAAENDRKKEDSNQ